MAKYWPPGVQESASFGKMADGNDIRIRRNETVEPMMNLWSTNARGVGC